MNYNTEMISCAAQQMAEMFKKAVTAQMEAGQGIPSIAQIEADMRETLKQIGNEALKDYLLFDTSENTVRTETEAMGRLQKAWEEALIQKSQD